jgi:hypothetical protein
MPNIRIRDDWDPIIRQMKTDHPGWGSDRIHKALIKEYPDRDVPSRKTIIRSLADDYDPLPYQRFQWPESMENGALPYEASNCLVELFVWLRYLRGQERPTIAACRWFYRVTQAAPDTPIELRWNLALAITKHRLEGKPLPPRVEWAVMMAAWNRDGKRDDYAYKKSLEGLRKDEAYRVPLDISPLELGDRKVPPLDDLERIVRHYLEDGWTDVHTQLKEAGKR